MSARSLAGSPQGAASPNAASTRPTVTLRLATTTSVADTGLLDAILPTFERQCGCTVDYVAVGTGQALEIGRRGDADVLLVHNRSAEERFVAEGFAVARYDVMYNDFVVVGPIADPAHIVGLPTARAAFAAIMAAHAPFASRGDGSGTHLKELEIWASLSFTPTREHRWYNALGQGMGDTLIFANEQRAYVLADRGSYLAMRGRTPELAILFGGATPADNPDGALLNRYGVMAVNPAKFPALNATLANRFVAWLLSAEAQEAIGRFGMDRFGQSLFLPARHE
ncbi:MAG: substrate-binding domain-containing protein [Anaerolineae bacterium]